MEGSAEFIKEQAADQLVVTGDIMSYLSEGNLKLAKLYVFDAFDNVLATLGNHEAIQKMQGTVEESLSLEERMSILKDIWCNDISYVSKVLEDKVMLVLMDNSTVGRYGSFTDSQVENLKKDLTLARANGYSVLLFYHIPLATENPADRQKCAEPYVEGDANTKVWDKASRDMYQLITQNGDVIKAAFCGHKHNDYTTEIIATDINGQKTVIPQYILIGNTYGGKDIAGNVLRITVN